VDTYCKSSQESHDIILWLSGDDDDKSSLFSYASLAYDETPIPFCGLQTIPFLQDLQIPAGVFATD